MSTDKHRAVRVADAAPKAPVGCAKRPVSARSLDKRYPARYAIDDVREGKFLAIDLLDHDLPPHLL